MNDSRAIRMVLGLVFVASAACGAVESRADAKASIEKEIARLEGELTRVETARPELKDELKMYHDRLSEVRSLQSPEAQLYRLRDAWTGIELNAMMADRKAEAASMETIGAFWKQQQSFVIGARSGSAPTLLQRALVEAGNNRAEKLFNASLAYAKVTEPAAGLYYISEAVANRRFADFAAGVEFSQESAPAPPVDALRNAWTDLETEALKVFEADPVGRTGIGPSARLKETRELIDRGSLAGATLLLLESRLELARRGSAGTYPAASNAVSDSMRKMWVEFSSQQTNADTAKHVTAQVVPLYDSLPKDRR